MMWCTYTEANRLSRICLFTVIYYMNERKNLYLDDHVILPPSPNLVIVQMDDSPSHLSIVVDLSPTQWHSSSLATNPLSLESFLAQLLTFLNTHIASKHENTLAVFAALPGKRFAFDVCLQVESIINMFTVQVRCSIPPWMPISRTMRKWPTRIHISLSGPWMLVS